MMRSAFNTLAARLRTGPVWTVLLWLYLPALQAAAQPADLGGEQIYQQRCVMCHGPQGEGTADHPKPLTGDRSLAELTRVIEETMPEGAPEECVGDEAARVAAYIQQAFYSPAAQARLHPPRVELSRLTVRQYQNVAADLIGSFRDHGRPADERGLRGEYFNDRRIRGDKRVLDRRDAVVDFDFGAESPEKDTIGTEEFSIRWQGSLLAPDTGAYELVIRTQNGARLWLNDVERPLIDAWVKSCEQTEYRESIFLLGGRAYPLRLEFFKFKEPAASIALFWKTPFGVEERIPERQLSPGQGVETFVVHTPFPPDDRSMGYERGTSVSKAWQQSAVSAAVEVADYVAQHLSELAGCKDDSADRPQRLQEFCQRFCERALRRPLDAEQRDFYVARHFQQVGDADTAVKTAILLVLTSPQFLYHDVGVADDPHYRTAGRLSFGLWDSLPDPELLQAAAEGRLATSEEVARQAQRMLSDPRARTKLRAFLHQWLKLDSMHDVAKDQAAFPEFNEAVVTDLRTSLDLFLDAVIWESDESDFRQLLLADYLILNGRLAAIYGSDLPADAPFQKVRLNSQQRAGILSHPLLMAGFGYHATSSPIHRGVFVARSLLGRVLRPPPEAVAPLSPELHADLTTRQRVILQTGPANCQTCHALINPLGFSLEHFDAVGRYRSEESGKPIEAQGSYTTVGGQEVGFAGARELAEFLAHNEETHAAFVEQLFHHHVKQPIRAFGPDASDRLRRSFAENSFNIRQLLVNLMTVAALEQGGP
jgi:mono/diheme cytochrome c family protein